MSEKFRNRYRIASARLITWDYGQNASYFVTICTKNRKEYFGYIENQIMHLSAIGRIASTLWQEIPGHFPFAYIGGYVVMPNHVHGIITIKKPMATAVVVETPKLDVSTVETPKLGVSTVPIRSRCGIRMIHDPSQ